MCIYLHVHRADALVVGPRANMHSTQRVYLHSLYTRSARTGFGVLRHVCNDENSNISFTYLSLPTFPLLTCCRATCYASPRRNQDPPQAPPQGNVLTHQPARQPCPWISARDLASLYLASLSPCNPIPSSRRTALLARIVTTPAVVTPAVTPAPLPPAPLPSAPMPLALERVTVFPTLGLPLHIAW